MPDLFGKLMGMGMNPQLADLHKIAKKKFDRGMVPQIPKRDGSVGPGIQQKPKVPGGPTIWERIARGQ
jgi:hypothetical protein